MVERLKIAVEKARAQREQAVRADDDRPTAATAQEHPASKSVPPRPLPFEGLALTQGQEAPEPNTTASEPETSDPPPQEDRQSAWNQLEAIELNTRHLERNRIVSYKRQGKAHAVFDVLRTRMMTALARKEWVRVGITSPSKGCGKTFVSANLAFSLMQQPDYHTILMDMDMRQPSLDKVLGVRHQDSMRWLLTGEVAARNYLRRVGSNLALGLNSQRLQDSAEIIQSRSTGHALNAMNAELSPNIVLYDLPPMLACDDVMGFLPQLDCVLLIVGGGLSRPNDVKECEAQLKDHQCPLLGVFLNRAEGAKVQKYSYY